MIEEKEQKITGEINKTDKIITWDQYSKHITPQDCWVLIGGYLYDVSDYLVEHPGGDDILLKYSGIDASQPFNEQQHSPYAVSLRDARKVGKIQTPIYTEDYRLMLQQKKNKLKKPKETKKQSKNFKENITIEEVSQHNTQKSCWIIINDKVYDVTNYMASHPGGEGLILQKAGKNATVAFQAANHSVDAFQKRDSLLIGKIKTDPKSSSNLVVIVFTLIFVSIVAWLIIGSFIQ